MRNHSTLPILLVVAAWLSTSLAGCDPSAAPTSPAAQDIGKPTFTPPGASRGNGGNGGNGEDNPRQGPERPIRGTFRTFDPEWVVSHFFEGPCGGGLMAGAQVTSRGNVAHLGRTEATASAAWDWAVRAAGVYAPEGPTSGPSATLLGKYPHAFCSAPAMATGEVVLVAANGDRVRGRVRGGEVYELDFEIAGDGQEQFTEVEVVGGTGRFRGASGSFVIHTIVDLADKELVLSEILSGGSIRY
jgi:hypothetical protein